MLTYLSSFSSSFIIAVALWPLLSAVLTLPILALMYNRHHRLHITSVLTAYICVLYALGLVAFTLYPMPDNPASYCLTHSHAPQLNIVQFVDDIAMSGKMAVLQLLFNMVLFIPLGFALKRWARWNAVFVLLAGFAVSALIETSQLTGVWGIYPCAYRQFDVDDLLTNTFGAVVGYFLAWVYGFIDPLEEIADKSEINSHPGLLHRTVSLIIDLIFVAVLTYALTFGFIAVVHSVSTPTLSGEFVLFGHTISTTVFDVAGRLSSAVAFLIFELLIPVATHGQTLGAMFTHMSVETKSRFGVRRAVFYVLRFVALYAATQLYPTAWARGGIIVAVVLLVFYLVSRRMPYDLT